VSKLTSRQRRTVVGVILLLAVVVIGWLFWLALRGEDETLVVLNNSGQCPEVTLTLTNLENGDITTIKAKAGQRASAEVEPNKTYEYVLDTNSEPDERGYRCYDIDRGTIDQIPKGRSVTINVPSIEATPDPRTPSSTPPQSTTPEPTPEA
jgi:hypothetical protein